MSRSRSRALASVRIRVEDGVDNLSVEAEKEWLRDADRVARPQRKTANTAKKTSRVFDIRARTRALMASHI